VSSVPKGDILNGRRNPADTDHDKLKRLNALSWLSSPELGRLAGALRPTNFKRSAVIFDETALASDAHILLKGIARITCETPHSGRITIALVPPGLIPAFAASPISELGFRCEAYSGCRVGSLSWHDFNRITLCNPEFTQKKAHESNLAQWHRLLLRSSAALTSTLHERVAATLLELASSFGIEESRGTFLKASFSHQDIAELVGATRPRVTEHLAQFEREHLLIRQGRQMIIRVSELREATSRMASNQKNSKTEPLTDQSQAFPSNEAAATGLSQQLRLAGGD
jgi:CRP/FNR family cyclic AMP-dependent transcriptional regulator